jgi:MoaA/NifB/PqqE/SkfB family radical SAM enzyme
MSAGPGKEDTTVSLKNFKKMLKNLPNENIEMILTGGELFTVEERLMEYLTQLKNLREGENRKEIYLHLQTNGFWLKRKNAKETLQNLKDLNVNHLDITSRDYYHRQQGLKLEMEKIELASQFIPTTFRGVRKSYVAPFGRAEKLKIARGIEFNEHCKNAISYNMTDVVIKTTGKVSPCAYARFEYPGNVFEEPLRGIIERAEEDRVMNALNTHGLLGLAHLQDKDLLEFSITARKEGVCVVCKREYSDRYGLGAKR